MYADVILKKKKKRLSGIRNIRAKFWDVMECNDNLKENRNIRSRFFMKMVNCHQIVIYTISATQKICLHFIP